MNQNQDSERQLTLEDVDITRNNVHAAVRGLPLESQKAIIKEFYSSMTQNANTTQSALFAAAKSGDAKLFAIFGGQGNIEEYFDELEEIWDTYTELVEPVIKRMSAVLTENARNSEIKTLHPEGFEILRWLKDKDVRPDNQYLISAPVSFPLIGFTQLLHYYVMIRSLGFSFAEVRDLIKGTYNLKWGKKLVFIIHSCRIHWS